MLAVTTDNRQHVGIMVSGSERFQAYAVEENNGMQLGVLVFKQTNAS
jgi:hypothetical protein